MTSAIVQRVVYFVVLMSAVEGICKNCRHNKCDANNNCIEGCKQGFSGRQCLCKPNCVDSICDLDEKTGAYSCLIGCTPGYHGLLCNTPCKSTDDEGRCDRFSGTTPDCGGTGYGLKCAEPCPCRGFQCDNGGKCRDDICIPGKFGVNCEKICNNDCKLCNKKTGKCIDFADKEMDTTKRSSTISGTPNVDHYGGYLIAIIFCLLLIAIAGYTIVWQNYRWLVNTQRVSVQDGQDVFLINSPKDRPVGLRKRYLEVQTHYDDN